MSGDFPGGPAVESPPSNAGDVGSIPGQGTKVPHASGQLSPCSRAHAPQLESPRAATREKPVRLSEDPACHKEDPMQPNK